MHSAPFISPVSDLDRSAHPSDAHAQSDRPDSRRIRSPRYCTVWRNRGTLVYCLAKSGHACVILAAVSAEISAFVSTFFAVSSVDTNFSKFCAEAQPVTSPHALRSNPAFVHIVHLPALDGRRCTSPPNA